MRNIFVWIPLAGFIVAIAARKGYFKRLRYPGLWVYFHLASLASLLYFVN